MMTQTEQRIAIAEWRGIICNNPLCKDENQLSFFNNETGQELGIMDVPNYPLDLNAMHEAEKKLLDLQLLAKKRSYVFNLMKLVGVSPNMHGKWSFVQDFALINATSQQRSEALCRILFPERFEQ